MASSSTTTTTTHPSNEEAPRSRTYHACAPCQKRRIKCNGSQPCAKCVAGQRSFWCEYSPRRRQIKPTDRVTKTTSRKAASPTQTQPGNASGDVAASKSTSPGSGIFDGLPELSNLSLEMPTVEPPNPIFDRLRQGLSVFNPKMNTYQFYGPSSHFCLIQHLYRRVKKIRQGPRAASGNEDLVPVAEMFQAWGLERQIFPGGKDSDLAQDESYLMASISEAQGRMYIFTYFSILHPQAPFLDAGNVYTTWARLCNPGSHDIQTSHVKAKSILLMVFAIGALLCDGPTEQNTIWAKRFFAAADKLGGVFEEIDLDDIHLLLLRGIYAMQIGKTNWFYLYLGHAARAAMTMGLHRKEVTGGDILMSNRLRTTFWIIFTMERISSVLTGRPTSLLDSAIDTPYPGSGSNASTPGEDLTEVVYMRVMIAMSKIIQGVRNTNYRQGGNEYAPTPAPSTIQKMNTEYLVQLHQLVDLLPEDLRFADPNVLLQSTEREVQRTNIGVTYYMIQILICRPAQIFVTFFDSVALAQANVGPSLDLSQYIDGATTAAKEMIQLIHDAMFVRCPSMIKDGNLVFFIVSACLTLLFEVLHPTTVPEQATDLFYVVEKGLQCLDESHHVASAAGKTISLDVIKVARDALFSVDALARTDYNMLEDFPWLVDETDLGWVDVAGNA